MATVTGAVQTTVNLRDLPGVLGTITPSQLAKLDVKAILDPVGVYLGAKAKDRFDRGVDPAGRKWAALKAQRNRRRDKRAKGGTGQKPLRDTGILMASMTGRAGARGSIKVIKGFSLEQGTNIDYGGYHQHGTRRMVARPFAGVNGDDVTKIGMIVADRIAAQMAGVRKV